MVSFFYAICVIEIRLIPIIVSFFYVVCVAEIRIILFIVSFLCELFRRNSHNPVYGVVFFLCVCVNCVEEIPIIPFMVFYRDIRFLLYE